MTNPIVCLLRQSFVKVLAAIHIAILVGANTPKAHYWPSARGHIGEYFLTAETLPRNLSSAFSWKFHHPEGRFRTVMRGNPLIDSASNVLILTENGLFKLSSEGRLLWFYVAKTPAPMNVVPCIMDDVVYGSSMDSTIYAVDLQTGNELWSRRYSDAAGADTSYVDARQGILLAGVDPSAKHNGGAFRVLGINSSTSDVLWELKLDLPTWNFSPLFPGDGSFIFMDISGGVHRVMHHTGERVWYAPVPEQYKESLSDGGVSIAPDGSTAFACSNNEGDMFGALRAYRISDGVRIWEKLLPTGCTSWPVIAKTSDWGVLPAGHLVPPPLVMLLPPWMPGLIKFVLHTFSLWMGPDMRRLVPIRSMHTEIIAFDTKTGATRWNYRTPNWQRMAAKGDEEGFVERVKYQRSPICWPTTWGTPTMSGDDTVYVGHVSGLLYAVKDHNGDDHIDPETEVSSFDMDAAPLPNNPAWAPGMMAVASCDTLFVFKSEGKASPGSLSTQQAVSYEKFSASTMWTTPRSKGQAAGDYLRPFNAQIKLIDFGNATYEDEHHSSIINTRQYRGPEVLLSLGWDERSDLWSIGCILMELYSGEQLFATHEEVEHLALMQRVVGPLPSRVLDMASQAAQESYLARDSRTGQWRLPWPERASSPSSERHVCSQRPLPDHVLPQHARLADFCGELLALDPQRRPSAAEAIRHPLFSSQFRD